jgi:hypothetical protein
MRKRIRNTHASDRPRKFLRSALADESERVLEAALRCSTDRYSWPSVAMSR